MTRRNPCAESLPPSAAKSAGSAKARALKGSPSSFRTRVVAEPTPGRRRNEQAAFESYEDLVSETLFCNTRLDSFARGGS